MDEDEEFTNEYDLISEEDIARIIASENGTWTKMTLEELLELHDKIAQSALKDNEEDVEYCACGDQYSAEDIATVLDAAENGKWVTRTADEMIAHTRKLCENTRGENDEIK